MKRLSYFLLLLFLLYSCGGTDSKVSNATLQSEEVTSSKISDSIKRKPPINVKSLNTSEGTLVYKYDSIMIVNFTTRVEARIIEGTGDSVVKNLISLTSSSSNGVIKNETIKVGKIMDMDLVVLNPESFNITKISSGDQPVDRTSVTEWLWGVTALKTGHFDMLLKAKIKSNNLTKDVIVFDKRIMVKNKPKKKYVISCEMPDKMKKYEEYTIKLTLTEKKGDAYNVEWGGDGKVVLDFDDKVNITEFDNYIINDNKNTFNYKWVVEPIGKLDSLPYTLKIVSDYDETIIKESKIPVSINLKTVLNDISNAISKNWYWLSSGLLIPFYNWLRKRYFPHKRFFKKKRKISKQ